MPDNDNRYVFFESDALASDCLLVSAFSGEETISQPFRFQLALLSRTVDVDFDAVLQADARLKIKQGVALDDGSFAVQTLVISGVVAAIEQREQGADWTSYAIDFAPHLWRLSLAMHSRIFLERTVLEIVESVLQEAGFASDDVAFRCAGRSYEPREFVVQHNESDLNFIQRLCEHEGIAYHFEHDEQGSTLVFTDSPEGPLPIAGPETLLYRPNSQDQARVTAQDDGTSAWYQQEVVHTLSCRQQVVPEKVVLKDFNWRTPQLDLRSEHDVPAGAAFGTAYEFGDHYKTTEEGSIYARLRAEEAACRAKRFLGNSDCRSFRCGATFSLDEHYRDDFNQRYLLLKVRHQGSQEIELESGGSQLTSYRNEFEALSAEVVFRPPRLTPKPRITGTINARIDANAEGPYAELDDQGRYKVLIPYDLSGRTQGQASRFVRMAQPYAGADMGMHFPLHAGTEVLLTHVNGDPDRPVISGAVPNPDTGSPVSGGNQSQSRIRTGAGMEMVFDDTAGTEQIMMSSPHSNTSLRMGGPGSGFAVDTLADWAATIGRDEYVRVSGNSDVEIQGNRDTHVVGDATKITNGNVTTHTFGNNSSKTMGMTQSEFVGASITDKRSIDQSSTMGASYTQKLAADINNTFAVTVTVKHAADFEKTAGVKMSRFDGLAMSWATGFSYTKSSAKVLNEAPVVERKGITRIEDTAPRITHEATGSWMAKGSSAQIDLDGRVKMKGSETKIEATGAGKYFSDGAMTLESRGGTITVKGSGNAIIEGSTVEINGAVAVSSSNMYVFGSVFSASK